MGKKKKSASSAKANAREQLRVQRERQQARDRRNARLFKIGVGVALVVVVVAVVAVVQHQRSQISAASSEGTPYPSTVAAGYEEPKTRTKELQAAKDGGEQKVENLKGMWRGVGNGEKDAPVVVETFADFSCPHCGNFERAGGMRALSDLVEQGKVRTVFYPVTLSSFQQRGYGNEVAAAGYACAADEGKGKQFAKAAFEEQANNSGKWNNESVTAVGEQVGLESGSFEACVKSGRFDQYLESMDQTMTDRKFSSTPTVVVNGEKVKATGDAAGLVSAMEAQVRQQLKKSGASGEADKS